MESQRSTIESQDHNAPPHGYYLLNPEHPLPQGYAYIPYVKADGTFPSWYEITMARRPKAQWVGKNFVGDWVPGSVQWGGRRKVRKQTKRNPRKGKRGGSRRLRRRV